MEIGNGVHDCGGGSVCLSLFMSVCLSWLWEGRKGENGMEERQEEDEIRMEWKGDGREAGRRGG